jgi:hypothetical protein
MPRVLSYGGGLDSFAALVAAIQDGAPPDLVVFIDVTDPEQLDPGEWPGTYMHIREVVIPLCAKHGIEFVWIDTVSYPVRDARGCSDADAFLAGVIANQGARRRTPTTTEHRAADRMAA